MANYKKVTSHGSVSIPVQMRRSLGIQAKDPVEVTQENGAVMIRPYAPRCTFCGTTDIAGKLDGKGICRSCAAKAYKVLGELSSEPKEECSGLCWACDDDSCEDRKENG